MFTTGDSGDFTENFQKRHPFWGLHRKTPCRRRTRPRRVWRTPCRHRRATRNEHDRVGKEEGNPVRAERAWAHQRRLHGVPKSPCAARRTPGGGRADNPGCRRAPPERPAGDPTHAMVQLDESAIARNVGRDLAFAASRLAARCHPGVGGCAAPSSLVIFGISQPNARSTEG